MSVIDEVLKEKQRQVDKWGGIEQDDQHPTDDFIQWMIDYSGWSRVMLHMGNTDKARRKIVQVAALAVAAVESMDRKK